MEGTLLANLLKALEYEEMLIGGIVALGKEKTGHLVHNRTLELSALTQREQGMAEQLSQLEKVRIQLNDKLASQLGLSDKNPNMSAVCAKLGESEAKPLADMQAKLQTAMGELVRLNQLNAELLKQSLDFVNFNIQLLAKPAASIPKYGRGGRDLSGDVPFRSVMDLHS